MRDLATMAFFELYPFQWQLQALETLRLGEHAGNTLRGALGMALADSPDYARWFRPESGGFGPSGLADLPRPFVLRASHLDGAELRAGETFGFSLHSFETRDSRLRLLSQAIARMAEAGLGPGRGRARAVAVEGAERVRLPLDRVEGLRRVRIRFLTPTELKGMDGGLTFGALFARARDRVSTLTGLYGAGPLEGVDFRGLGERSLQVKMTASSLHGATPVDRRSTRTGQTHGLNGLVGEAEFEGEDLGEFVPWLEAAAWTGVGRQTVWGKGAIEVTRLPL